MTVNSLCGDAPIQNADWTRNCYIDRSNLRGAKTLEKEFWIKAWTEGRTAFHQREYHAKLTTYFPQLQPTAGQSVLVPLCGKSLDMLWLLSQGLRVHGVELHQEAVEAFFTENRIAPVEKAQNGAFTDYAHDTLRISCGDFFQLDASARYDFVYDRAALVALPFEMRKDYARVITRSLPAGGKYLLVVYEYDQAKMEGPPFSVSSSEIHDLYAANFSIRLMEEEYPKNEGPRLGAVVGLMQKVYFLERLG